LFGLSLIFVRAAFMVQTEPDSLQMGRLLLPLAGLEFLGVALLGAFSFRTGALGAESRLRMAPAVLAALGFALTNGVFSGLILLAEKRLTAWPELAEGVLATSVRGGEELLFTDIWFMLVLATVVVIGAWIISHRKRASDDGIDSRTARPGRELDGADPGWKESVRAARGLATAGRRGPYLLLLIVVMFFVVGVAAALLRLDPRGSWLPWDWTFTLTKLDTHSSWLFWNWSVDPVDTIAKRSIWWQGGAWLLALLPLLAVGIVRRANKSATARRTVGILWDVLTFWPRRFHPFGVRPYSERAVVELRGHLTYLIDDQKDPVLFSAHSQGSILAFAALAALGDGTKQVALVTYGSPIRTLFATAFPAYFGADAVAGLREILLDGQTRYRWRNYFRDTDPIGGPVFEPNPVTVMDEQNNSTSEYELNEADKLLPDPAIEPRVVQIPPGNAEVESDLVAWIKVAGHSHYLREVKVKKWVHEVKDYLTSWPPQNGSGGGSQPQPDTQVSTE
jgi:hypothetical protein